MHVHPNANDMFDISVTLRCQCSCVVKVESPLTREKFQINDDNFTKSRKLKFWFISVICSLLPSLFTIHKFKKKKWITIIIIYTKCKVNIPKGVVYRMCTSKKWSIDLWTFSKKHRSNYYFPEITTDKEKEQNSSKTRKTNSIQFVFNLNFNGWFAVCMQ